LRNLQKIMSVFQENFLALKCSPKVDSSVDKRQYQDRLPSQRNMIHILKTSIFINLLHLPVRVLVSQI
jgi:hypothetical protein